MRAAWLYTTMVCEAAGRSRAGEQAAAGVLHRQADDAQSLQENLLALAQERLRPAGLFIERQHTSMTLSGPLPSADLFEVWPTWPADTPTQIRTPSLTFELRPKLRSEPAAAVGHAPSPQPIRATLVVTLLRDVWVTARPLRKGSVVTCADFSMQRRPLRDVPRLPLATPCVVGPVAVALRDMAAGDVVRSVDIGRAPDAGRRRSS